VLGALEKKRKDARGKEKKAAPATPADEAKKDD
jgi:hypothetical protein